MPRESFSRKRAGTSIASGKLQAFAIFDSGPSWITSPFFTPTASPFVRPTRRPHRDDRRGKRLSHSHRHL